MATYWDTSCILKLYCPEPDSDSYLDRLEADTEPPVSSVILDSEFAFALQQKVYREELRRPEADRLLKRFHADLSHAHIRLLPFGKDIQDEAARIARICYGRARPIPLRTLDGLHLATAVLAKCRRIITTDERMRTAARALKLELA